MIRQVQTESLREGMEKLGGGRKGKEVLNRKFFDTKSGR